jgi:hypothetical protein
MRTSASASGKRDSSASLTAPTAKLRLVWHGHVVSFKNKKHSGRNGFVYTEPKARAQMKAITAAFREQLRSPSTSQTSATGTLTG